MSRTAKLKAYFAGTTVVITGGSSGIGLAIARQVAAAGAHVVLIARNAKRLQRAAGELRKDLPGDQQVLTYAVSVTDYRQLKKVMSLVARQTGQLDVLINSAGRGRPGHLERLPLRMYRELMETNYLGTVYSVRAALPWLKQSSTAHIMNVGSVAGFLGIFGFTAYSPTKFAVHGFTEALRSELRFQGVRVSLLCPPDTDTPGLHAEREHVVPELEKLSEAAGLIPADLVARRALSGMVRGKFLITANLESRLIHMSVRRWPNLSRWVVDRIVARSGKPKTS